MKKRLVSVVLVAAFAFSMLAGCGSDNSASNDNNKTSADAEQTATNDGDGFNITVNFASEPMTMDPALNSAVDGSVMANHLFEGLMKWESTGEEVEGSEGTCDSAKLTYGQAESYDKTTNDDGTVTYTFHLRDGIKWSDGKDVTAGDFEYSWKRLADPATAADYCYMIDMVQGYAEVADGSADKDTLGIKAVDDKNLEITLSYDCPYFEEIMAFPATFPVRQDIVEGNEEWTYSPETYIGNGAYKMVEWSHNAYILTEKSETYYDYEKLGPDTIKYTLLDDNNAMLAAFNSGELNFIMNFPTDEMANYLASGQITVAPYIGTYYVCFNTEDEVFSNPLVRQAFSLVIDRNYIVENVSQSGEVPATGYVPSGVYDAEGANGDDFRTVGGEYYSVSADDYQANCDKARELLAEAGYPNGEGFPAVEYMYNTDDRHKAIAEALQNMWQTELGVTVNLSNQDWNVFLKSRKDGDFQIARNGWIADYNDPCSFLDMWYTGGGNNDAQYSNPEYDALIDAAKATSDQTERMAAFHKAEDLLIGQDSVLAPIYFYTNPYMLSDNISGMYYTPLGYFFFGYTQQN